MIDQTDAIQTSNPAIRTIILDGPVMMGEKTLIDAGQEVTIRKPNSGHLRGLSLSDLNRLDVTALQTLLPRITTPTIARGAELDPADLMQLGGEVMDFLLPSAVKAAIRSAYPTE